MSGIIEKIKGIFGKKEEKKKQQRLESRLVEQVGTKNLFKIQTAKT